MWKESEGGVVSSYPLSREWKLNFNRFMGLTLAVVGAIWVVPTAGEEEEKSRNAMRET